MILSNKLILIKKIFFLSASDNKFCIYSMKKWKNVKSSRSKGIVLVDSMYCEQYIFEISFVTNYFKERHDLDIKYFIFSPRNKYLLRFIYKYLLKFTRLDRLYRSFGAQFGFSNFFQN